MDGRMTEDKEFWLVVYRSLLAVAQAVKKYKIDERETAAPRR